MSGGLFALLTQKREFCGLRKAITRNAMTDLQVREGKGTDFKPCCDTGIEVTQTVRQLCKFRKEDRELYMHIWEDAEVTNIRCVICGQVYREEDFAIIH